MRREEGYTRSFCQWLRLVAGSFYEFASICLGKGRLLYNTSTHRPPVTARMRGSYIASQLTGGK